MSEENEGEEDKQKDDFSGSEEFDFYFPFTKPLVLDLPTEEDRVLASAWVQKLEDEPESNEEKRERLKYLKLLLFALQRGRLSGIFRKEPPSGSLEPFPPGFSIFDMANWMLEQDDIPACGGGDAGHLPYTIEMSNDLREFIASQEIPNFGVQMYYAWSSDEPIDKWSFFDEEKFPQYILDKIKQLQEIRSDEKSTTVNNGCKTKQKGCNLSITEKYSQKKVKSPQEIERSQGRSFHAYMGLVGRMGNFNDKCDDDPKKFQRQDQRKGKCPRRTDQKKCPGSGGEAEEEEDEEEFDNPVSNLDGLGALNRPCVCPYPCHHPACPDHHSKGEPQPSNYEDQQPADRNCGFRPDSETSHWNSTVIKSLPRRMREQCVENEMPTQKKNAPCASSRPRSSSPNPHSNLECLSQGNSGEFPNVGICTCNSPPCPCPCPRVTPNMSVHNTPSTRTGGRGNVDPNRTFTKSSKQDPCFNENRDIGSYHTAFTAPDPCASSSRRPDLSPVGGRTHTSSGIRPVQPEVIHCYDTQNPDPALNKRIDTNSDWVQTVGGGNKFMNPDLKMACRRTQLIAAAQQNKCKMASRRELFCSQQQSSAPPLDAPCQQPSGTKRRSPPLESHPVCEYSPPEEAPGPSNQQEVYPQQNYLECEGSAPPQTCFDFYETCERQVTDTYKKPGSQTTNRLKNTPAYYPSGPFGVRNDTGRLANMASVLQGIKQKTEAHREKCGQMRPPVNEMRPENRVCRSPQPPSTNVCSSSAGNKAYTGLTVPSEPCPLPGTPYPGYVPSRSVNYQQDECDFEFEEEDDFASLESLETCPQEAVSNRPPRNDMQGCRPQEFNTRENAEHFRKTLTPGNCAVNFAESAQCFDPKYINLENMPPDQEKTLVGGTFVPTSGPRSSGKTHLRVPVSSRECGHQRTSPERTLIPESSGNVSFKTMTGSSNDRSQVQWVSPRAVMNNACLNEEPQECFNAYQENDMRNCHPQMNNSSTAGNRYFNDSLKSHSGQNYQNVTSTPLKHYKRNFADQGTDDLSPVHSPSNRCP